MANNFKVPGVYPVEKRVFGKTVVSKVTAVPVFIGYTQKEPEIADAPKRINSFEGYFKEFGGGNYSIPATIEDKEAFGKQFFLFESIKLFYINGGQTCYVVSVGKYLNEGPNADSLVQGIKKIFEIPQANLVLVPDAAGLGDEDRKKVYGELLKQCSSSNDFGAFINQFALLDASKELVQQEAETALKGLEGEVLAHGAMYHPWLKTNELTREDVERSLLDTDFLILKKVEDAKKKVEDAKKKVEDAQKKVKTAQGKVDKTEATANTANEDSVKKELESANTELQVANAELQAAETKVNTAQQEVDDAQAKVNTAQQEVDDAQAKVNTAQSKEETNSAKKQLEKVNKQLHSAKTTLQSAKAKFDSLQLATWSSKAHFLRRNYPDWDAKIKKIVETNSLLPPTGAVAGAFVRSDEQFGIQKAPANIVLRGIKKLHSVVNDTNQGQFNVPSDGKSINCIRSFINNDIKIWGARTLDGNVDDFRYVNVRRTMSMLQESIKTLLEQFVFDDNNERTWLKIRAALGKFLRGMLYRGVLYGNTPSEAYEFSVGLGQTMSEEDLLDGIIRVHVKLALIRPAEFIVVTFEQKTMEGATVVASNGAASDN
jgi:phage tail sheath protein FI